VALAVFLWGETGLTQELSTIVFPSEDELLEALNLGEIGYEQYLVLREVAGQGVDSSSAFLFDEIPNLAFFGSADRRLSWLEQQQEGGFVDGSPPAGRPRVRLRYRYYQLLDEEERDRYRLTGEAVPSDNILARFKLYREYSGRERLVSRSLTFTDVGGAVPEITLGSYCTRLGLGTIFGYPGRLLEYSGRLDVESLAFPDYGGYNGLKARLVHGRWKSQVLTSYAKDSSHAILSAGAMISRRRGAFKPGFVVGFNRVRNRANGATVNDFKAGLSWSLRYPSGSQSVEVTGQAGDGGVCPAAVIEGQHRLEDAEINFAAWAYGDRFVDLTSGSKAALFRRDVEVEETAFTYANRRAGQEGLLLKTIVLPGGGWEVATSALVASGAERARNLEFLGCLRRQWSDTWWTELDYLTRARRRNYGGADEKTSHHRLRFETGFQSGNITGRAYIALTDDWNDRRYVSFLGSLRCIMPSCGTVEFWSNVGCVREGRIEYWYAYVRYQGRLSEAVTTSVKLANRYRSTSGDHNQQTASLAVDLAI